MLIVNQSVELLRTRQKMKHPLLLLALRILSM